MDELDKALCLTSQDGGIEVTVCVYPNMWTPKTQLVMERIQPDNIAGTDGEAWVCPNCYPQGGEHHGEADRPPYHPRGEG